MIYVVGPSPRAKGGIASVLACLRDHGFFDDGSGIAFVPSFETGSKVRKATVALRAMICVLTALLRGNVKALHVHSAFGGSFLRKGLFALLAFMFRRPVVFHIHNGAFEARVLAASPLVRRSVYWILRRSTCVVVLTQPQRDFIALGLGHPWVELFPNPVDIPSLSDVAWPRAPNVAFLANLTAEKGLFELLAAWKTVVQSAPNATLSLCGLGDESAVIRAIASSGLESSVRLRGWVGGAEKSDLLAQSSVVVLPSQSEALPMSVLEGMAHGCAIVATRVGAVPDAVRDGVDGHLVEVGDVADLARTLTELLADPERCARMGAAARCRAEQEYSPVAVMRRYRKLYDDVSQRTRCV